MGLDADLCRRARELYGWEMKFAGDYRSNPCVEISRWLKLSERPAIGFGVEGIKSRPTYGFVDCSRQDVFVYQPFAAVYGGREHDYQEDLVRAALLHLRKDISEKPAEIIFPSSLQGFVRSYHLWLLEPGNKEVISFCGGTVPIYREGSLEGITTVLNSFKIDDHPRE